MLSWDLNGRRFDLGERTHIMGVLNVTPDSFSDGGRFLAPDDALRHGLTMVQEGADFLDIGGESTRPRGRSYGEGARPVSVQEETDRVVPVIERLRRETDAPLSIDTTKSAVAEAALGAGATIVNDVSGMRVDERMPQVAAAAGASVILMHTSGSPQIMQSKTAYADLFGEIAGYLRAGADLALRAGVRQIMVDPGIGFGKTVTDNLRLIMEIGRFRELGYPVLVGPSRKAFIGEVTGLPVGERLEGTIAAVVAAILGGVHVVRVHDVLPVARAARVADALAQAGARPDNTPLQQRI
jgi:dihydropteroate synthase